MQSAQVREATAHLLVLEPFEFRARFALSGQELAFLGALQALARVRAALVRVSVPAPGLRLPSLYSTAPDGLSGQIRTAHIVSPEMLAFLVESGIIEINPS